MFFSLTDQNNNSLNILGLSSLLVYILRQKYTKKYRAKSEKHKENSIPDYIEPRLLRSTSELLEKVRLDGLPDK